MMMMTEKGSLTLNINIYLSRANSDFRLGRNLGVLHTAHGRSLPSRLGSVQVHVYRRMHMITCACSQFRLGYAELRAIEELFSIPIQRRSLISRLRLVPKQL